MGIVKKMINHLVVFRPELIFTHIVISMPMDFQAMLKRVEAGGYKSKHEFKGNLDLIWSNCGCTITLRFVTPVTRAAFIT